MEISSLVLYISFIFSTLIFLKKLKTKKSNGKFPPGPRKLPFIGNLHNLVGAVPHRALHRLARKFGPMMSLQLGELSTVIVSSADAAREIMKTHDINFASRPSIAIADIIGYGGTSITFSPHGDYWRLLRKICTLELLSAKRVQSFRPLRESVFMDVCRKFADHSMKGLTVNFSEEFISATYALISRTVLGMEDEGLLHNLKRMPELAAGFDIAEVFPSIKLFKVMSRLRKKLMDLHKDTDRILEEAIHQHRVAQKEEHRDLLDVLLKTQEDGLELPLTDENVKSVLVDLLSAGSETSATVAEWVMTEMLKKPRVLQKAQEEVRQVFDKEGKVDESRIHELMYLKLVVKETLRLHPPAPLLLPRKCGKTCEINGYEIPAETKIIINASSVNRDPKYWEDADCFIPERFLDSEVDFKGNNFEYIPFGAGRRICPGIVFGLANLELPLAMFLYHFDWELGGGMKPQDLDMEEIFGATAKKLVDLSVVPIIKRPLPTK